MLYNFAKSNGLNRLKKWLALGTSEIRHSRNFKPSVLRQQLEKELSLSRVPNFGGDLGTLNLSTSLEHPQLDVGYAQAVTKMKKPWSLNTTLLTGHCPWVSAIIPLDVFATRAFKTHYLSKRRSPSGLKAAPTDEQLKSELREVIKDTQSAAKLSVQMASAVSFKLKYPNSIDSYIWLFDPAQSPFATGPSQLSPVVLDELINKLGLAHYNATAGVEVMGLKIPTTSLPNLLAPTVWHANGNPVWQASVDANTGWNWTLDLRTMSDGLPEAVHPQFDWSRDIEMFYIGKSNGPARQYNGNDWEQLYSKLM